MPISRHDRNYASRFFRSRDASRNRRNFAYNLPAPRNLPFPSEQLIHRLAPFPMRLDHPRRLRPLLTFQDAFSETSEIGSRADFFEKAPRGVYTLWKVGKPSSKLRADTNPLKITRTCSPGSAHALRLAVIMSSLSFIHGPCAGKVGSML